MFQVGFSHSNILQTIIRRSCMRFPNLASYNNLSGHLPQRTKSQQPEALEGRQGIRKVFVIFGGNTSERQVSLISGTNVWLNLQTFDDVSLWNRFHVMYILHNSVRVYYPYMPMCCRSM